MLVLIHCFDIELFLLHNLPFSVFVANYLDQLFSEVRKITLILWLLAQSVGKGCKSTSFCLQANLSCRGLAMFSA